MLTTQDLCSWLRHNVEDLRLTPDMVTEAAGHRVRLRWHGVVAIEGQVLGFGVDLRPEPGLGELWLYGHGARDVRLQPDEAKHMLPPRTRERLLSILLAHASDRDHDVRGRDLYELPWRVDAVA